MLSPLLHKIVIEALGAMLKRKKAESGYNMEPIDRQKKGKLSQIPYQGNERILPHISILSEFFADDKQSICKNIKV